MVGNKGSKAHIGLVTFQ